MHAGPLSSEGPVRPRTVIGQRRYVTVLFADVSGSSEHAERLEAEDYAALLDQFRQFAREIIPHHGGSIARLQGDGVLALFGHQEAREDDGRRAAEAALDLHEAVGALRAGRGPTATALSLHSGIHAGLVLLIDGDIERGRYDVVGEVPNSAARLCSLAQAGEILVSAETLGPLAHFFRVVPVGMLPIRGRSAPLTALRVEGRADVGRRIDAAARRGVVPFVGREAALAELWSALLQAEAGGLSEVVISGEPGIGKTRLIGEFLQRLGPRRTLVLQGFCEAYLGAEPLQPFMQVLRSLLDWLPHRPLEDKVHAALAQLRGLGVAPDDTLARHLMTLLGGERDAGARVLPAEARSAALVELIERLGARAPFVLVLDDWQWADDASRELLGALRARRLPALVILAQRPVADEVGLGSSGWTLALHPLPPQEAEQVAGAWLPGIDPFVLQEVVRQAGGSPLFLEELCHAAAAGGALASAAGRSGGAWLHALVASRLERLPPDQAECLRIASVLGTVVPVWLLERIAGTDGAVGRLEALVAADFLVPASQPGMLRFKHALTREAVYATVAAPRRIALHGQVVECLEACAGAVDAFDWVEALSYHCHAAGLRLQAAQYAEAAGDRALAAMALDRARAQYTTALRSLDALAGLSTEQQRRWCAIAQKLGQTCVFDPLDVAEGFVFFERAQDLARALGDDNIQARAAYWLGYVSYGKGLARQAVTHCRTALAHAQASGDQRLATQVRATLGQALASAGRYEEAFPLFEQAVDGKRRQAHPGSRTAIGSAYTLARMAYTLGDLGRFDEAWQHFDESLELLGDALHSVAASVRELMCAVYLWQGRWEEARASGLAGADIALRCRSRYLTAMGRALAACAAWAAHGDAASWQTLRDNTLWIEARGGAVSTSLNYGWLVEGALALGLDDEARRHAAQLLRRARAQDRHGEAQGCRALARAAAQRGQPLRAQHYLAAADRAARDRGSAREHALNALTQGEIAALRGHDDEAWRLGRDAAAAFEALQMPGYLERARRLLGAAR